MNIVGKALAAIQTGDYAECERLLASLENTVDVSSDGRGNEVALEFLEGIVEYVEKKGLNSLIIAYQGDNCMIVGKGNPEILASVIQTILDKHPEVRDALLNSAKARMLQSFSGLMDGMKNRDPFDSLFSNIGGKNHLDSLIDSLKCQAGCDTCEKVECPVRKHKS